MARQMLFTSESVTEGHPDKVADQISDAVLDAHVSKDPQARVACETLVTTGNVIVAGEITSKSSVDYEALARATIESIGYTSEDMGFDARTCKVSVLVGKQSPDISQGVTLGAGLMNSEDQGAGDQGIMFGYAVREADNLMPYSIDLAHRLSRQLSVVRKTGQVPFFRPDGKTQVTVRYEDGVAVAIDAIVVSTQHTEEVSHKQVSEAVQDAVIRKVVPASMMSSNTKIFINPTGRFVIGGPHGDCGLTGRKIIVDTYGGHGSHGGGAFSGKDPSKVDRSACYMARYIAKNIVAAKLADRCLVQLAYAIGVAEPVSVMVQTYGTETRPVERIEAAIRRIFTMRPSGIIEALDLYRPQYLSTAAYGHFGREDQGYVWEKTDKVSELLAVV